MCCMEALIHHSEHQETLRVGEKKAPGRIGRALCLSLQLHLYATFTTGVVGGSATTAPAPPPRSIARFTLFHAPSSSGFDASRGFTIASSTSTAAIPRLDNSSSVFLDVFPRRCVSTFVLRAASSSAI